MKHSGQSGPSQRGDEMRRANGGCYGADLVCGCLRAVMLAKSKGWRPLGIKEAECRFAAGCFATQKRPDWDAFYAATFMPYWTQRLSAAIVGGDARRGLTALARRAGLLLNT